MEFISLLPEAGGILPLVVEEEVRKKSAKKLFKIRNYISWRDKYA